MPQKINITEKPKDKGAIEYLNPQAERKILELFHAEEQEEAWGIPLPFLEYFERGGKKYMKLKWSGIQLARTIEERTILMQKIETALETQNPEQKDDILKDALKHMEHSFIERGKDSYP